MLDMDTVYYFVLRYHIKPSKTQKLIGRGEDDEVKKKVLVNVQWTILDNSHAVTVKKNIKNSKFDRLGNFPRSEICLRKDSSDLCDCLDVKFQLNDSKNLFQFSLSRTRTTIQNMFGFYKIQNGRFNILSTCICYLQNYSFSSFARVGAEVLQGAQPSRSYGPAMQLRLLIDKFTKFSNFFVGSYDSDLD